MGGQWLRLVASNGPRQLWLFERRLISGAGRIEHRGVVVTDAGPSILPADCPVFETEAEGLAWLNAAD